MEKELILQEIIDQNKHWKGDLSFFEDQRYHRPLFYTLQKYLPDRQILSIVGLRRVGKTILMKQLIKYLIDEEKVLPRNIIFLAFDEALLSAKITLKDYLDACLNQLPANGARRYIFLDEIQYADKWQHIIKRFYDNQSNIKFILSGSSSLFIKKKATESLAGRIYDFKLGVLSFAEFLEMSQVEPVLRESYNELALEAGAQKIINPPEKYNVFLVAHGNRLEELFADYLLQHQFPEMIGQTEADKIRKYISESVYKKTIEYDIPRIFGADKIGELRFVFQLLISENSNLLEYQNIASEVGIEINTLKKYLHYFSESFLFDIVYNYSQSFRKSRRLQKKGYVASANFFQVLHPAESTVWSNQRLGRLAETYIYWRLKEVWQYISFYRQGSKEIDFAVRNNFLDKPATVFIETKYTNKIDRQDTKFLEDTARKFKNFPYLIYSKNTCLITAQKIILPCFLVK